MRVRSEWLLAGYVFFLPIQVTYHEQLRLAPSDFFLLAYLVLNLPHLRVVPAAWSTWMLAWPALLLGGAAVTIARTGDLPEYVLVNKLLGAAVLMCAYLALTSADSSWARTGRWMRIFVISAVWNTIASLLALAYTWKTGVSVGWWNYGQRRVSGLLVDPNAFGGLLVLALAFLTLVRPHNQPLVAGWMGKLSYAVLMAGIGLTFSRSAWLAMAALLCMTWAVNRRAAIRLGATIAGGIIALLLLSTSAFLQMASTMASRPAQVQGRFELMKSAWNTFVEYPLTGAGLGHYFGFGQTMIHNSALMCLAELGVLGVLVFVGLASWFVIEASRLRAHAPWGIGEGLLAGQIVMLTLSMGIEALSQRHWWMTLAFIGAGRAIVRNDRFGHAMSRAGEGTRWNEWATKLKFST